MMIDRYAIIVGAMKSGTTNLFRFLEQHPQICPCKIKEPAFFNRDENLSKGLGYYESLWDWNPAIHKIALEASTSYTKIPEFPNVAERIASSGIPAKIIYIMRDPINRIQSQLRMSIAKDWYANRSKADIQKALISFSQYYMQISHYYKCFPEGEILLLCFEDLINAPDPVLKKVCTFLEIDDDFKFVKSNQRKHSGEKYLYESAKRSSSLLAPLIRFRQTGLVEKAASYLPERARQHLGKFFTNMLSRSTELTPRQKRDIVNQLKDDIGRLNKELNFDTSAWKSFNQ